MSSVLSVIRESGFGIASMAGTPVPNVISLLQKHRRTILDHNTIHILAHEPFRQAFIAMKAAIAKNNPSPVFSLDGCIAPQPITWLEAIIPDLGGNQVGLLCEKEESENGFRHTVEIFLRSGHAVAVIGSMRIDVDEKGRFVEARAGATGLCEVMCFALLHVFSLMSCVNIKLFPIVEPKSRPSSKLPVIPACVWHTIKIRRNMTKRLTTGKSGFSADWEMVREHWVRGHFITFTAERPAFGRLVGKFWRPEHKRGNPELGCVIPEYQLTA